MRVLLAAYAEKTHFLGMVPLAWALQNAGHEVRVASQPALTEAVTSAGLTAVPLGRDHRLHQLLAPADERTPDEGGFDFAERRPEVLDWPYLRAGYANVVPWWFRLVNDGLVDALVGYARRWRPDLVLWEPVTFAGAVAAEAVGAAHARMLWCTDLFTRMRQHYLARRAEQPDPGPDPLQTWLTGLATRHGVAYAETLTTGHFTVDTVPPSLRADPELGLDGLGLDYLSVRPVPYHGRSVVPDWLRAPKTRPRVAVTMGVSSTEALDGYSVGLAGLLASLAHLDAEVVATVPPEQQAALGPLPDNVRLVPFTPLDVLVPTCDVVVGHGGYGSYCTVLARGVPQVVVPFFFDGGERAEYLARQGAGVVVPPRQVGGVAAAVARVLADESYVDSAARLAAELRGLPTPSELVRDLELRTAKYGR
ncbi:glycosyltransferase (activator-dependent family) [Crossiella equi]|uniref:Glycosyltransferase (Activator-dependent family) n=1 Tax=Crossiella equi TaxID=130796 RepID=A0ABS5AA99_9PSEU|nr:activator-dependent family glycosyltransferase [Crossiella equi]MBP2473505.1 glycosyltransferase (activator-dependent family) [Crossiella equi]